MKKVVAGNTGATLIDIGDGVACLEFHTKMNTLGSEVIQGIHKAIDRAETEYEGLVSGNQGANFSAGANLGLVFMFAIEQEYDEIDFMVRQLEKAAQVALDEVFHRPTYERSAFGRLRDKFGDVAASLLEWQMTTQKTFPWLRTSRLDI